MGRRRTVVVALAVLTLAGCGEDREGSVEQSGAGTDTTGTSTTPVASGGKPVATVKVKETEYSLFPDNPKIDKVGLVKFEVENAGTLTHALEVEGPGGAVETKGIDPGKSSTLEAELSKPGAYKWYCPIDDHESRGMKGQITVAGGGSGAARDDSGKDQDPGKDDGTSGSSPKRKSPATRRDNGGGVY